MVELSVVCPVFNEEAGLGRFHARLAAALGGLGMSSEILYVDDGSTDGTPEALARLQGSGRVRVLRLSRNFGHQLAITAGLDHCVGAAAVVLDADGQDPPEMIAELVAAWRAGAQVVCAVRASRPGDGALKRLAAAAFYRLLRRASEVDLPAEAGDFRLLDRRVLAVLGEARERHRYLRGLSAWAGFKQVQVPFSRGPRLAGRSHYTLGRMLGLALDAATAFSPRPLRWLLPAGLLLGAASLALLGWVGWVWLFNPQAVRGWASIMGVLLLLGGVELAALGLIGEYLARVFEEVKRRPLYVVESRFGFD